MGHLTKQYEDETGEKAMYRVDGAIDYHTLRYVKWLEAKVKNFTAHNRQSMPCCDVCGSSLRSDGDCSSRIAHLYGE